jgi:hypothetical protein
LLLNIKDKLKIIKEEIEKMYLKGNSTQEFWDYFKKELEDRIDENIPQKSAKIKDGKPWITRDIKRIETGCLECWLFQLGLSVITLHFVVVVFHFRQIFCVL